MDQNNELLDILIEKKNKIIELQNKSIKKCEYWYWCQGNIEGINFAIENICLIETGDERTNKKIP